MNLTAASIDGVTIGATGAGRRDFGAGSDSTSRRTAAATAPMATRIPSVARWQ